MIDAALQVPGLDYASLPNDPSVPNPAPLTIGTLYTFQQAGATIPAHAHADSNLHFTVIISGSFTVVRQAGAITAQAGDVLTFAAGDVHSFTALEAGSLFNALLAGAQAESFATAVAAVQSSAAGLITAATALNTAAAALPVQVAQPVALQSAPQSATPIL